MDGDGFIIGANNTLGMKNILKFFKWWLCDYFYCHLCGKETHHTSFRTFLYEKDYWCCECGRHTMYKEKIK